VIAAMIGYRLARAFSTAMTARFARTDASRGQYNLAWVASAAEHYFERWSFRFRRKMMYKQTAKQVIR
jgi:hypothetical protein